MQAAIDTQPDVVSGHSRVWGVCGNGASAAVPTSSPRRAAQPPPPPELALWELRGSAFSVQGGSSNCCRLYCRSAPEASAAAAPAPASDRLRCSAHTLPASTSPSNARACGENRLLW